MNREDVILELLRRLDAGRHWTDVEIDLARAYGGELIESGRLDELLGLDEVTWRQLESNFGRGGVLNAILVLEDTGLGVPNLAVRVALIAEDQNWRFRAQGGSIIALVDDSPTLTYGASKLSPEGVVGSRDRATTEEQLILMRRLMHQALADA